MDEEILVRKKIFGLIQRLIHAWIGSIVLLLIIFGWTGKLIRDPVADIYLTKLHIIFGYALIVGIVARLVWGFLGPQHALLSELLNRSCSKNESKGSPVQRVIEFGHDPIASLVYIIMYLSLAFSALSGLILAAMQKNIGPFASIFFDDFRWHELTFTSHEWMLYVLTLTTIGHFVGMQRKEKKAGIPIAQAMLSGFQYRKKIDQEIHHD